MDKCELQSKALPVGVIPVYERSVRLEELIRSRRPAKPLYVLDAGVMSRRAAAFVAGFPGKPLFAVKTNPDPVAIQALIEGGVSAFDVASLAEIQLVKSIMPSAELHFMHPVKMPEDIRAAYFDYGVRDFVLDHEEELFKIMRETDLAQDLNLTVRVALPKNDSALIDFSSKFGASFDEALELLKKCRPVSKSLGLSFHVGTQTSDPGKYAKAIAYCAEVICAADVDVDSLNVGGGFPVAYQGDEGLCSVEDCFEAIATALRDNGLSHLSLLAEPGRVLVAEGGKLVARVELRKGDLLYINDGVYGGLFDAAKWVGTHYPVSAVSCDRSFDGPVRAFKLAGPTCDSLDMMDGPFMLPEDIGIGDWVVFDNAGAYSQCLRSDFNGFGYAEVVCLPPAAEAPKRRGGPRNRRSRSA
ncbi:MAG: type III PLP-dependent enzyme [Alphaproteobacteria bacterium]|nr:type III PLP-dependent enzyme [Alphaproteobacteria bacterium]